MLGIVDYLGIDAVDDLSIHPPRMTEQSDELSEEWLARYSADAAVRR